jgi:hypothetical protein
MAFPGELNITYYKGDTYEFQVTPKKNDNTAFNLSGYSVKMSLSETKNTSSPIEGYAEIDTNTNSINCAITPGNGLLLDPEKTYVYEVEIKKNGSPYNLVYTILTGTISVIDQVSAV